MWISHKEYAELIRKQDSLYDEIEQALNSADKVAKKNLLYVLRNIELRKEIEAYEALLSECKVRPYSDLTFQMKMESARYNHGGVPAELWPEYFDELFDALRKYEDEDRLR